LELKKSKDRTQVREPEANLGHQFFFEVEKVKKPDYVAVGAWS
jgi:hypothetical protein